MTTLSSPPVQLCLQLAVSSVGHDVLLSAALRGDAADVEHEVGPLHSGAIWGPQGAARLPRFTAHLALLGEKYTTKSRRSLAVSPFLWCPPGIILRSTSVLRLGHNIQWIHDSHFFQLSLTVWHHVRDSV